MPPTDPQDPLTIGLLPGIVLFCSLSSVFFLTMARQIFPLIAENFDAADQTPATRRIREYAELPHLREGIAFGRAAGAALSLLLLFRETAPLFLAI